MAAPTQLRKPLKSERGQGLTEYSLMLVLVAAVAVAALTAIGGGLGNLYTTIVSSWP